MNPAIEKPKIGITLGDPSGIGPEVTLKALDSPMVRAACSPILVGSLDVVERAIAEFSFPFRIERREDGFRLAGRHGSPMRLMVEGPTPASRNSGSATARQTIRWIAQGARLALSGMADALATAPVSKESLLRCGIEFTGHTEFLESLSHSKKSTMMFVSPKLVASIVTTHLPLEEVPCAISRERVLSAILHTHTALRRFFKKKHPRIAVSGLNPHAGEGGFLGKEEKEIVSPAVKLAARRGVAVSGPFSADSIFLRALKGEFDAVVAMFHDQALPVLKTLFPKTCVNVTLGLPFVRTSPGHGAAKDIAWKGEADESGMVEAILLAARLSRAWKRPLVWSI
ncbi:MAG: 4-hydroxythreonine-4-phosphate dehydrogenase PdxA [Candidatus Eisenbacteria bacterium]|nr:4-hydroxythreonine-4-phosphate dehydrogenase PdxA [Candidatus Eisenbacteria bacterium]